LKEGNVMHNLATHVFEKGGFCFIHENEANVYQ